jgi:xanthine dehydrogenase accessory factor
MKNIYIQLLDEFRKKRSLAFATIIEKKGSAPQIPGTSALISTEGLFAGTVGGGIMEADAQKKAFQSLHQKASILYKFGLTHDISSEEGAICGGEATILIDACPQDHAEVFQSMSNSLRQRKPGVLATFIGKEFEGISITRYWLEGIKNWNNESGFPYANFSGEVTNVLTENKPSLIRIEENLLFLEPVYPFPHLIIAGAGHIGQAVTHLGNLLDFEVTVIDDRKEFANKEKLPEADNIIVDDIGKAMQTILITPDTYIVIVTRGHTNDADALRQCIDSEAAYVGMIGSTRKIELMREEFLQEGWATSAQWKRIYAPIGVEIQSKTVQEIAISIAAQLVLVRRQKKSPKNA